MNTVSLSRRRSFALPAISTGRLIASAAKATRRAASVINLPMAAAASGALATVVAVAADAMPAAFAAASLALASLYAAERKGGAR